MAGPPIGLHEALEAEFVAEDPQVVRVGAGVLTTLPVVGAHDRRGASIDSRLEGSQVQFESYFVVDVGGLCATVCLLLVEDPVLRDREDSFGLDALDVGFREDGAEMRILPTHVLEVSSVARDAMQVQRGSQDAIGTFGLELRTQVHTEAVDQGRIPGGAHAQEGWPDSDSLNDVWVRSAKPTCRILHVEAGHAKSWNRGSVADVDPLVVHVELGFVRKSPAKSTQQKELLSLGDAPQCDRNLGHVPIFTARDRPVVGAQYWPRAVSGRRVDLVRALAITVHVTVLACRVRVAQHPSTLCVRISIAAGVVVKVVPERSIVGCT
mmetsp:Transcript_71431/g.149269  ORF Transcript_71431/g.149269 Transcript_71431/m.149269 type:complete len:323 (+) Transcript_71431:1767-2735(+)